MAGATADDNMGTNDEMILLKELNHRVTALEAKVLTLGSDHTHPALCGRTPHSADPHPALFSQILPPVSYTHLTLPTTPYV